jgi:hypothetical protein
VRGVWIMALAGIALAAAPAPAQLQPEAQPGSRILTAPQVVARERAGVILKGFAQCLYRQNPQIVQRLVLYSDPIAIDFAKVRTTPKAIGSDLGMPRCLGKQAGLDQGSLGLRFTPTQLRAQMLEEDYLARFKSGIAGDPANAGGRVFFAGPDNLPKARVLADFSDCLAAKDAPGADAVLRTMPRSKAERVAATAMTGALSQCLDTGVQIELTPAAIRIYAADGLWTRFARVQAIAALTRNGAR